MAKIKTFVVQGVGGFPGTMLRRDLCWPRADADVDNIFMTAENVREAFFEHIPRRVELCTVGEPNRERWASFGWEVIVCRTEKIGE